jgi:hypothetical protein
MSNRGTDFETILKWAVVIILAIVALKVVATILGIAFVLGGFLLWRILPLVLVAWLVMRLFRGPRGGTTETF